MGGDVTLERPAGAIVELELSGWVSAEPQRAVTVLAECVDPDDMSQVVVDAESGRVVVQGGYWYRGEYLLKPDGDGTQVTFALVNVAPGSRLMGRITGRRVIRSAPREFEALLDEIRTRV